MTRPSLPSMNQADYQSFVRRLEKRHSPDKPWSELPVVRRPGRPPKGTATTALKPRSVKLPQAVWLALATAAKRHGVTASGVVAGLVLQATTQDDLDRAIDGLISQGILTPG